MNIRLVDAIDNLFGHGILQCGRYRVRLRFGLATQWAEANPVLRGYEIGREIDTRRYKRGDGVNAWNDLPYVDWTLGSIIMPTPPEPKHGQRSNKEGLLEQVTPKEAVK